MSDPFFMQWHITDACPLRCAHCYRGEPKSDLLLETLRLILARFAEFLDEHWLPGVINFAGGEPLVRRDELLCLTREAAARGIESRVLTNGILLDAAAARDLRDAGCRVVQVSLDGGPEAHEAIRGDGTHGQALSGARHAREAGMVVTLSFTASRLNRGELPAVVAAARRLHARLFVSRLVPLGRGAALRDELLTPREWLDVMRQCARWRREGLSVLFRDPLFGRLCGRRPPRDNFEFGGCAIGSRGLAVESTGDAYPCRRLPIHIGNLAEQDFEAVWGHPLLESLRDRDRLTGRCGTCRFRWRCGGCRAVAYAVHGDPLAEDPQCPWEKGSPRNRSSVHEWMGG